MKSDLILRKYKTETVVGSQSSHEVKNFFGSKMLEIEDTINIDNSSIQYSDVDKSGTTQGFQYYEYNSNEESIYIKNLTSLKNDNHTITLDHQSQEYLIHNTKWTLEIDGLEILRNYLFYKIKESRVFKCVYYDDLKYKDINKSIYDYIDSNVINRYKFVNLEFYVYYSDIDAQQTIYLTDPLLRYDPKYNYSVLNYGERVNGMIVKEEKLKISATYKQTKRSLDYKFDYYFNLVFEKI